MIRINLPAFCIIIRYRHCLTGSFPLSLSIMLMRSKRARLRGVFSLLRNSPAAPRGPGQRFVGSPTEGLNGRDCITERRFTCTAMLSRVIVSHLINPSTRNYMDDLILYSEPLPVTQGLVSFAITSSTRQGSYAACMSDTTSVIGLMMWSRLSGVAWPCEVKVEHQFL